MPSYLPGEGGYGMDTRGAWGGSVNPTIERVINTNNSGTGSLRAAVEAFWPRVILVETSGRCHLTARLFLSSPYCTIAGQCAPDPGFIVSGFGLEVTTHDVVCQYFGILPGEFGFMEDENCSFITYGQSYRVIADHMTLMWGPDETAAVVTDAGEANTTFIDCIIAEGLQRPTSVPASDSHGGLVEAYVKRVAWIRCLFAGNKERNPYWQDGCSMAAVNCFQYNWEESWSFFASQATPEGGLGTRGWQASIVNCVQKPGPLTNPAYEAYYDGTNFGVAPGDRVYRTGTLVTNPLGKTLLGEGSRGFAYNPNVSSPPPNAPLDGFPIMAAADVEAYVLAHAGMRPSDRISQLDGRVISQARNATWPIVSWVTHQDDVGGYPSLAENYTPFSVPANPHSYTGEYTNLEIALQAAAAALNGGSSVPVDDTGDATNITPETATVITGLPYTATVDDALIDALSPGTGYVSTCDSTQRRAMWWKYTAVSGDVQLSVLADVDVSDNYDPKISIWTGDLGSPGLTQYVIGTQNFCQASAGGYYLYVPVTPGEDYYVQVTDANSTTPVGAGLVFSVTRQPSATAPAGSILIPDDEPGFPAAVIASDTDSTFLAFVNLPSTEYGASMPTGEIALSDNDDTSMLRIYDWAGQTEIASHDFGTAHVAAVKSDYADTFYVVTVPALGGRVVTQVSRAGVIGASWTLPVNANTAGVYAVARDGSLFYYAIRNTINTPIHAYNLNTSSASSDLIAGEASLYILGPSDGEGLVGGDVLFGFGTDLTSSATKTLRRYSSAGALTQSYAIASAGSLNRYTAVGDDAIIVWTHDAGNIGRFETIQLSDGAVLATASAPMTGGSGQSVYPGNVYAISDTCPLLITAVELTGSVTPPDDTDFEDYTPPVIAVPVPTPTAPLTPCPPQAQTGNGGKGNAGCNTGGVGATPSYNGPWGDVPEHADPDPGETLTGKNGIGVEIWVEINHTDYPSGDVTQILRAKVPLADPSTYEGGYKTDGLLAVGNVEHAFGNERGGFEAATVDIRLFDKDPKTFRVLADTQEFEGDELFVKLASDEARV